MAVRKALFAGSWYPGTAEACRRQIAEFQEARPAPDIKKDRYYGGIVPHAGWYFSGAVACQVFSCLSQAPVPDCIVVYGMHLHASSEPTVATTGSWETPLGDLDVHTEMASALVEHVPCRQDRLEDFSRDNTIELQLPFIKHFFSKTAILPVGVPPNDSAGRIGRAVASAAREQGIRLLSVGSTDLTHYGPNYGFQPHGSGGDAVEWVRSVNDRKLIDALLAMAPDQVITEGRRHHNACCAGAAAAALITATEMGADQAELVAYATSYDKRPDDSFVGYVGVVF